MSLFTHIKATIDALAQSYDAEVSLFKAEPVNFEGTVRYSAGMGDTPRAVAAQIPLLLQEALKSLPAEGFRFDVEAASPASHSRDAQIVGEVSPKPIDWKNINEYPEFPRRQLLARMKSVEKELCQGWREEKGSVDSVMHKGAVREAGATSLVKEFPTGPEGNMPLSVMLLSGMAASWSRLRPGVRLDKTAEGWKVAIAKSSDSDSHKTVDDLDLLGLRLQNGCVRQT